jgi:hypothetical protein
VNEKAREKQAKLRCHTRQAQICIGKGHKQAAKGMNSPSLLAKEKMNSTEGR